MAQIHPTSLVDPKAQIAPDADIGPFCVIGPNVTVGRGSRLLGHVTIVGETTLGSNNTIYPHVCIGYPAQDLKSSNDSPVITIGDENIFRESATVHGGTSRGRGKTAIGNHNQFMNYSHVGHDSLVGNHCTFVNHVSLAGHCHVEDFVTLSGYVGVTQFVHIGSYSMIGAGCIVPLDFPPFLIGKARENNRVQIRALNRIGLTRAGFSTSDISSLDRAFRILFRHQLTLEEASKRIHEEKIDNHHVASLMKFIRDSEKGIAR